MANQEQVELLQQGRDIWNEWRTLHPEIIDLSRANLRRANLSEANLSEATLVGTNLTRAILNQCTIYGISVWNVQLDGAKQDNLVVTGYGEPTITVDNLEVAQFIYLLLNNTKI